MRNEHAVTLIEMLVVILILGILSAVAYRTIDATTRQSKFDETEKEMSELIKALVGNPEQISDGRRINFGYVGDMGELPNTLNALVSPQIGNWKGPYLPTKFLEDSINFKIDAWGNQYQYNPTGLAIQSSGGGRQSLTIKIADSIVELFNNRITGTVADIDGAPPADFASKIRIILTIPREGYLIDTAIHPRTDGYYEFVDVPIGYHPIQLVKEYGTRDSMIRWISVIPRSSIITDFKFATSFRNNLKYVVNSAAAFSGDAGVEKNNFSFRIFNSGDTVTLDSMIVISIIDTINGLTIAAFYEEVEWNGTLIWSWQSINRAGIGEIVEFSMTQPVIIPNDDATFIVKNFMMNETGVGLPVDMPGKRVNIRFSDGSVIDFTL